MRKGREGCGTTTNNCGDGWSWLRKDEGSQNGQDEAQGLQAQRIQRSQGGEKDDEGFWQNVQGAQVRIQGFQGTEIWRL